MGQEKPEIIKVGPFIATRLWKFTTLIHLIPPRTQKSVAVAQKSSPLISPFGLKLSSKFAAYLTNSDES